MNTRQKPDKQRENYNKVWGWRQAGKCVAPKKTISEIFSVHSEDGSGIFPM